MLGEPTDEGLGQCWDLHAQPTLGQLRQGVGVTLPGDQRFEHRPPGHAHDVRCHRRQLDPGVLEQLLQPLDLAASFPGDRRPGPGQVPQLADRLGRHERSPDQAIRSELGQPRRIRDVGLAARQVLHMPSVDQQHLHPGQILEQVVERLPVVAGRLHHHTTDLLGGQMVTQREDLIGRRPPRRDGLDRLTPPRAGHPDAHLGILLRDVHPSAPGVHHVHQPPSPSQSDRCPTRGGQEESESLTHGLKAPIHGSRGGPPPPC